MKPFRRAGFLALTLVAFLAACGNGGHTSGGSLLPNANVRRTGASTASFGPLAIAINCGGPATGYFGGDKYWSGASNGLSDASPIDVSAANAAPAAVYASNRTATKTLAYNVTGLSPNVSYTGYLHFEEPQATGSGQRIEGVSVGGTVVAAALDIYAAAGAAHKAVVVPFTASADGTGTLQILLTSQVGAVIISGYEIYQAPPPPTPAPTPTSPAFAFGPLAVAVDAGGPASGYFVADKYFYGASTTVSDASPIDVSAPNAAPTAIYGRSRTAATTLTYLVTGLTANATYTGYLHFEEPTATGAGQRVESVSVGGVVAAPGLDIYAVAGAAHKAMVVPFTAAADGSGTLRILLTAQAGNAIIAGFEIYQALPPTPPPSPVPTFSFGPLAVAVDAGGPANGYFVADKYFYGSSTTVSDASPIDVSAANAAPAAVYARSRTAASTLTYNITGLTPNLAYAGFLHFEEPQATGAGQRVESINVGGVTVAPALDIYAVAGAHKAVVVPFTANADGTGTLQILLTSQAGTPILAGFEIYAAVTPTPTPSPPPAQSAGMSDAFVNSVGINVHLSYFGTLYGNNFGAVQSLLTNLGIRHVRDTPDPGVAVICNEDVALGVAGIHFDVIAPPSLSMNDMNSWMSCIGSAADEVEGPNEYDISGDANWVADLRAFQQNLYSTYAGRLPVLAPAVSAEEAASLALGSLSGIVSNGNMHSYFAGRNPGTGGWGSTDSYGTYGSLSRYMAVAAIVSGTAPVQATETGYSDAADTNPVPAGTKADYTLRTYLVGWNAGASRTYDYQLVDQGTVPFSHYGLTDASGNVKPAYTAMKNVLAHLSDPGSSFTPAPLNFSFTAVSSVQRTLLEKRNGTYELIVWNELPEWDAIANIPITVTPVTATIGFAKAPHSVAQTTIDANGNATTVALSSATSISFTVTSTPTILDLSP